MNVEELRDYSLSLGADVEERMPFVAFRVAQGVLAFYVCSQESIPSSKKGLRRPHM